MLDGDGNDKEIITSRLLITVSGRERM